MIKSEKVEYKSTVVKCSYYDKDLSILILEFVGGARYIYYNVKEDDYEDFRLADSQGTALPLITNNTKVIYNKIEDKVELIGGFTKLSDSHKIINNNILSLLQRIENLENGK